MNTPEEILLFIVPGSLGDNLRARYVCLTSSGSHTAATQHWYTEHSLVELSIQIDPDHDLDWSFIEEELAKKAVYRKDH